MECYKAQQPLSGCYHFSECEPGMTEDAAREGHELCPSPLTGNRLGTLNLIFLANKNETDDNGDNDDEKPRQQAVEQVNQGWCHGILTLFRTQIL